MRRLITVAALSLLCACHPKDTGPSWVRLKDSNLSYDKNSVVQNSGSFTVWMKVDSPRNSNGDLVWTSEMFYYNIVCHDRTVYNMQHSATAWNGEIIPQPLDYNGAVVGIPPGSYIEMVWQQYC
jgi:hypothetical protein